jgi:hypothetical protein
MKYETIGGKIKDTDRNETTVRELRIGDRFKTKSSKHVFEVWNEKCDYNTIAGSSTRKCKNITIGLFEHKLCRLSVTKL